MLTQNQTITSLNQLTDPRYTALVKKLENLENFVFSSMLYWHDPYNQGNMLFGDHVQNDVLQIELEESVLQWARANLTGKELERVEYIMGFSATLFYVEGHGWSISCDAGPIPEFSSNGKWNGRQIFKPLAELTDDALMAAFTSISQY